MTTKKTENAENKNINTVIKTSKQFNKSDLVLCKSVRFGEMILVAPRTGNRYEWLSFGDETYIEYQDLAALRAQKSPFIFEPWIVIEDAELVEQWKGAFTDTYKYFENINTLEEDLKKKPRVIMKDFETAPSAYQDLIFRTVGKLLRDGNFDSINTVRRIDKALGSDLAIFLANDEDEDDNF